MAQQPQVGQGLLVIEASRSHSDTPQSVGFLWTSDETHAETSAWQYTRQTSMPPEGFEPTIPAGELPQTHALGLVLANLRKYSSADKSLARPGRKQATATENFEFHVFYLYTQVIHKRMVRFQKLTRNLFLTLHGHNVHRQQRQLSKFLMRYQ